MKLLALFLVLVFALVGLASAAPRPVTAGEPPLPDNWPALLNCSDVNADGYVTISDVGQVIRKFGENVVQDTDGKWVPDGDYMLLYDLDGGGNITTSDIATAVDDFGSVCDPVETQVAAATLAVAGLPYANHAPTGPDLRNWSSAQLDGWEQTTQYVFSMGIHVQKPAFFITTFDETQPVGLIYKSDGGTPDELIGLWYVVPIPEVCTTLSAYPAYTGLSGVDPGTCDTDEPEGFAGPEDNTDFNPVQRGWHDHPNLCIWNAGTSSAFTNEDVAEESCTGSGGLWFGTYGYMTHLYNFIPNFIPDFDARFMMWNFENLP